MDTAEGPESVHSEQTSSGSTTIVGDDVQRAVVPVTPVIGQEIKWDETPAIEPPCQCWDATSLMLGAKKSKWEPLSCEIILPLVRNTVAGSVKGVNLLIELAQQRLNCDAHASTAFSEDATAYKSCVQNFLNGLETASTTVMSTPGYVCRPGSQAHYDRYTRRNQMLCTIEEGLRQSMEAAEPLTTASESLIRADKLMRLRANVQLLARVVSAVAVPFSPVLSAALTAFDVLALSTSVAVEEYTFPEAAHIRETLESVEKLKREIQQKASDVSLLRAHLDLLRETVENAQRSPIAAELSVLLEKILRTKRTVEAYFSPQDDEPATTRPDVHMRNVITSFRSLAETLGEPTILDEPMSALTEEQCDQLDTIFIHWRSSCTLHPTQH